MSKLVSYIVRMVAVIAVITVTTTMSWAGTIDDGSATQLHKGHRAGMEATLHVTGHGLDDEEAGAHHDTLCATACALAGAFPSSADLEIPLGLALKLGSLRDLEQIFFAPEPGRRPPKTNLILV